MKKQEIPAGVMHEPSSMAWAQLTPTRDHIKLIKNEAETVLIETPDGTTNNPLPITKATTLLRRAYPYIFNCAAYMLTHYKERIKEGEFYKSFLMPADVFYKYCLDDCTEQRDYLKKEIYEILAGENSKAKYIKVSKDRTVFARPVIIALSHTNIETGKDERIKNIGQDKKVDKVEIQILKELMTYEHGYLNVPKAFYAKTRRIYNIMRNNAQPYFDNKDDYWSLINHVKSTCIGGTMTTAQAARHASAIFEYSKILADIEQGDFHKIYLALEYILINRKRGAKKQTYDLLKLCEKCAPEYTQEVGGKLYYKDKKTACRFFLIMGGITKLFRPEDKDVIGIEKIDLADTDLWDTVEVFFK